MEGGGTDGFSTARAQLSFTSGEANKEREPTKTSLHGVESGSRGKHGQLRVLRKMQGRWRAGRGKGREEGLGEMEGSEGLTPF